MNWNKISGVKPHKAPPIIRWIGAYPSGTYSLEKQIKFESSSVYGKSSEAMKHRYKGSQSSWYSKLGERTMLGLVVDQSKTPLHRCYKGDVGTDRGYQNSKKVPLLTGYREEAEFVVKYKQIWNGISVSNNYSYDECVIGNGKNPICYMYIIYHKDREQEALEFSKAMNIPAFEYIRDNGKVRLPEFPIKDYFELAT